MRQVERALLRLERAVALVRDDRQQGVARSEGLAARQGPVGGVLGVQRAEVGGNAGQGMGGLTGLRGAEEEEDDGEEADDQFQRKAS